MRLCTIPGCTNPHCAKGLCHPHYVRKRNAAIRAATTKLPKNAKPQSTIQELNNEIEAARAADERG